MRKVIREMQAKTARAGTGKLKEFAFPTVGSDSMDDAEKFPLDCLDEMDKKFDEFSKHYRQKYSVATPIPTAKTKPMFLVNALTPTNANSTAPLTARVATSPTNAEEPNTHRTERTGTPGADKTYPEPILKQAAIAMGNHILKKATRGTGVKFILPTTADMTLDPKFAMDFGISIATLRKFKTEDEKNEFVGKCILDTMRHQYREWEDRHQNRQTSQQVLETRRNHEMKLVFEKKNDHYKWLELGTHYESLQKKLREILVQTLNEWTNRHKIEDALAVIRQEHKDGTKRLPTNQRVLIESVASYDTTKILKELMNTPGTDIARGINFEISDRYKFNFEDVDADDKKHRLTDEMPPLSKKRMRMIDDEVQARKELKKAEAARNQGRPQRRYSDTDIDSSPRNGGRNTSNLRQRMTTKEDIDNKLNLNTQYFWNASKEDIFMHYRSDAKFRLSKHVRSTSWNEVGFSPLVQASNLEEKQKLQREVKLEKYMDGEGLSAEELKYLVNTSLTLNQHLDKRFYQSAVNILHEDVLKTLEIQIAEEIINNYQHHRKEIMTARREFLASQKEQTSARVRSQTAESARAHRIAEGQFEQKKVKKSIEYILSLVERRKKEREAQKKPESASPAPPETLGVLKTSKWLSAAKANLSKPVVEQKKLFKKVTRAEDVTFKYGSVKGDRAATEESLDVRRHRFHPASKLPMELNEIRAPLKVAFNPMNLAASTQAEQAAKNDRKAEKIKQINKEVEDFKLRYSSAAEIKNPANFVNFYSGGPAVPYRAIRPHDKLVKGEKNPYTYTPLEVAAAIKIQAMVRRAQARMRVLQIFREEELRNQAEIQRRLQAMKLRKQAKEQMKLMQAQNVSFGFQKWENKGENAKKKQDATAFLGKFLFEKNGSHSNMDDISDPHHSQVATPGKVGSMQKIFGKFPNEPQTAVVRPKLDIMVPTGVPGFNKQKSMMTALRKNVTVLTPRADEESKRTMTDGNHITTLATEEDRASPVRLSGQPQTVRTPKTIAFPGSATTNKSLNRSLNKSQTIDNVRPQTSRPVTAHTARKLKAITQTTAQQQDSMGYGKKAAERGLLLKQRKLIYAAKSNTLQMILSSGFVYYPKDMAAKDEQRNTALYYAAQNRSLEFCKYLLKLGANPNDKCQGDVTPLHVAFASDDDEVVLHLINGGGDLNSYTLKGQTPLAFGSERLLKRLNLQNGVATFTRAELNSVNRFDNNKLLASTFPHFKNSKDMILPKEAIKSAKQIEEEKYPSDKHIHGPMEAIALIKRNDNKVLINAPRKESTWSGYDEPSHHEAFLVASDVNIENNGGKIVAHLTIDPYELGNRNSDINLIRENLRKMKIPMNS